MGRYILFMLALTGALCACSTQKIEKQNDADNVEVFVFSDKKIKLWRPLQIAYKSDGKWVASENKTLTSFFGDRRLRPPRQMTTPYLFVGNDGLCHCIWAFGDGRNEFAHSSTPDFFAWSKQDNAALPDGVRFLNPVVKASDSGYTVFFKNGNDGFMKMNTADFKNYSTPKKIDAAEYPDEYAQLELPRGKYEGAFVKISPSCFEKFIKTERDFLKKSKIMRDTPEVMAKRLGGKKVSAKLALAGTKKSVNKKMSGLFFEDIFHAADGGLYPELVQNRDFEYSPADNDKFHPLYAWKISPNAEFSVEKSNPISKNNPTHLFVKTKDGKPVRLENSGWDGIDLKGGAGYDFSVFAKSANANGMIKVFVKSPGGSNALEGEIALNSSEWKKYSLSTVAKSGTKAAPLALEIEADGGVAIDMVSLFPRDTFKGRKNGLRKDLAETLAALKPNFVRFPGGCIVHADKPEHFYRWQYTIGKLENRKPLPSLWKYHQTFGLGYLEYFQFCEDLNAEPLPVVSAGTVCQIKGNACIPLDKMPAYIDEVLALIEWANGDPEKTKWGKVRAENGHPAPFGMKYLGIGNEDEQTENFKIRYLMIKDAVNKKYPDIIVIGSSGILSHGQDYTQGRKIVNESRTPIIDDHCYEPPEWFIANADYYDNRDRNGAKVYLGEYAPRNKADTNTVYTALCSAFHLANLERNGDLVKMVSYAPLLSRIGVSKRKTMMVHFDNTNVYPTPEYYVQKLFSHNAGDVYRDSKIEIISGGNDGVKERVGASVVDDSESGETVVKLINLLPVECEMSVDLDTIGSPRDAVKTVLTCAKPDDESAKISEARVRLGGSFTENLPPYSLVVIKFKKGQN